MEKTQISRKEFLAINFILIQEAWSHVLICSSKHPINVSEKIEGNAQTSTTLTSSLWKPQRKGYYQGCAQNTGFLTFWYKLI